MTSIDIDFDVFKALTMKRKSEAISYNDVLRELLDLPAAPTAPTGPHSDDWIASGIRFPQGTEFRATFKGKTYLARVEDGSFMLAGNRYGTPSSASLSITGYAVNGWRFWECRRPGEHSWQLLDTFRR